jgi:hypothetical protein
MVPPMRFLALALILLSTLLPLAALAGEAGQPLPGWPTPPQIVDPALGLPSPWRYIDGEGRSNSPCLGDISTPACLYDTMVACGSWNISGKDLNKGSPGYPYGPDWIDNHHPLCQPLRWTPIPGYKVREAEPASIFFPEILYGDQRVIYFYRLYSYLVSNEISDDDDRVSTFRYEEGDLAIVPLFIFCFISRDELLEAEKVLFDDPSFDFLLRRLPEECWENDRAVVVRARRAEGRWWAVTFSRLSYGPSLLPTKLPLHAFYLSIRK